MNCWRIALGQSPDGAIQYCQDCCLAIQYWRKSLLRERATSVSPGAVVAPYAAAASKLYLGPTLGERFAQGVWPREAVDEGAKWRALWFLWRALGVWSDAVEERSALAKMDDATAVLYANYGAGRSPVSTI